MRRSNRFDEDKAKADAAALNLSIPDDAVPTALAVNTAHAATQGDTLGNVRTRAATVLSSAALAVTFATSVGLISSDGRDGAVRFPPLIALLLLGLVIAIGALTFAIQKPVRWSFDSGTNIFGKKKNLLEGQRAALEKLEVDIARNEHLLSKVLRAYRASVALLGIEAAVVVLTLILV